MVNQHNGSSKRSSDSTLTKSIAQLVLSSFIALLVAGIIGLFSANTRLAVIEIEYNNLKILVDKHNSRDENLHREIWKAINETRNRNNHN